GPPDGGTPDAGPADSGQPGSPALVISELIYDFASLAGGDDTGNELVEIAGPPGASLDGTELVVVAGDGAVITTIPLSGTMPQDGLYVVASEAAGGGTHVQNADRVAAFSLPDGAG